VTDRRTVSAALEAAAGTPRGLTAIEHDGSAEVLPYAGVYARALEIGAALSANHLAAGERVALIVPEVGDFIRAFFGISAAGLVPVPLVPPGQAGDLPTFARQTRQLLIASRVAAVVASSEVAPLVGLDGIEPKPRLLTLDQLHSATSLATPVALAPDAPALIQFTSGSTAAPKGVVLTHANLDANISAIAGPAGLDVRTGDVGVSWLPLYHDMGLIGMLLTAVYTRSDAVIMSPVLFLKRPTAWLDAISRHRASVSFAPSFAYELCLRRVKPSQVDGLDLSTWRVAGCGAEPIRHDTLAEFAGRFARAGFSASSFAPSYGLAEHSLAVAFAPGRIRVDVVDPDRLVGESLAVQTADLSRAVRLVGCGRAFPGHEIRIVDDDQRPVGERRVGHIQARGPSVMAGYFAEPRLTADTLRDGWLHTGDLGYIADGELFVCGRTKDVIIRAGRKYHPPDLEAAIADLDGIRSSAVVVFGINRAGEADEVVAVLEARASAAHGTLEEGVRRRVRETAGLELDRVVVAPPGTIPRTTSGKVRRAETRSRLQAGTLVSRGAP
jgi:acyl-CoA synthetase (AMP-forming)/AMP-acid ligase II